VVNRRLHQFKIFRNAATCDLQPPIGFCVFVSLCFLTISCSPMPQPPPSPPSPYKMNGPLVSSRTTMVTAWFFPRNPLTAPSLDKSTLSDQVRWGFRIFTSTPQETPQFAPGKMSCSNCHLNGGQRERSLPLVAVAGMFPEYNRRAGRLISLNDRIVDCFLRSENATGSNQAERPFPASKEVLAVQAYITWLAQGFEVGKNPG